MRKALWLLLLMALLPGTALADGSETVYTLVDAQGQTITSIAADVDVGDEYIAGDDTLYRVASVDAASARAVLEAVQEEPEYRLASVETVRTDTEKSIGIYVTHSDESYEDGDGTASLETGWAGVHDVASALSEQLEEMGVHVDFDPAVHLPHDAGAYRRSRVTAVNLAEQGEAALIDVHRDGIPDAEEYETEIDGESMTKVRLLVGRSNPNSAANRQFAKKLKAAADSAYPGLIKDIFIGKGNYNQELMPHSILLEFGTHTSNKEEVLRSTRVMADVLNTVLFGSGEDTSEKQPAETKESGEGKPQATAEAGDDGEDVTGTPQGAQVGSDDGAAAATGIAWMVGLAVLGVIAFAVISSGHVKGLPDRLKRFASELTGGWMGKGPKDGGEE